MKQSSNYEVHNIQESATEYKVILININILLHCNCLSINTIIQSIIVETFTIKASPSL